LSMLALAGVGGAYLWGKREAELLQPRSPDLIRAQRNLPPPLPGQAAIALVIGYDHRANEAAKTPSRSDTGMLARADPTTKSLSMLSFPRDLTVQVTCPKHPTFLGRINEAYAECKSVGTLATVQALTHLPINFLITVNFRGFKQVVDRLDGIWVD